MSIFRFEIENLQEILLSNGYYNKFIDKCIYNLKLSKIVSKVPNPLRNYFSFKYIFPEPPKLPERFSQIYNFTCGRCNVSDTGKIFRYMKVRVLEQQGMSP